MFQHGYFLLYPLDRFLAGDRFMARIPEHDIEQLKQQVSLVRLVEADGIALTKQGRDYAGRCPFHEDATPSLIVTPAKNLYHCFGCNAAGGPIDWVMHRRGVSFRHAVETLRTELGLIDAPVVTAVRTPASFTLAAEADRQALLRQVLGYYRETLTQSPDAMAYLAKRGLQHPELIARFQLGYANRSLGYRLPDKQLKAGAEQRGRLQTIGLLRDSGVLSTVQIALLRIERCDFLRLRRSTKAGETASGSSVRIKSDVLARPTGIL
ncbi:CHC2 zinc finger domain-containing protein [Rhodanobacter sp. A1T4]|uniref:CHC2 zinc finger domain-containing protein n=1 Tax=Rhodanobacter sp. A1T4 TaxID=2723087 RepID=UPI0017CFF505|nr:CHC2 zinc finger domain-containing protein [Rhodanobacter sp. A1T4]MBB6249439.1 DNA primase catalytic core [Rhodanobacter sp. A1T4]